MAVAAQGPAPATSSWRRQARFCGLELELGPTTAAPGSAILVQAVVGLPAGAHVHDIGCGSGAVALAVKAARPDLRVSACDADPEAVAVAAGNAARLGLEVEFSCAERWWAEGASWDLALANLPYYGALERSELVRELGDVPLAGLVTDGGDLDVINELVHSAPAGQRLAVQHRRRQSARVRALFELAYTWLQPEGQPVMTLGRV